jgi:hypothetical protein
MSMGAFLLTFAKVWAVCVALCLLAWVALQAFAFRRRDAAFRATDLRTWTLPIFVLDASFLALIVTILIALLGDEALPVAVIVGVAGSPGLTALTVLATRRLH